MPACHAGDRRFDPGRDRHFSFYEILILIEAFFIVKIYLPLN